MSGKVIEIIINQLLDSLLCLDNKVLSQIVYIKIFRLNKIFVDFYIRINMAARTTFLIHIGPTDFSMFYDQRNKYLVIDHYLQVEGHRSWNSCFGEEQPCSSPCNPSSTFWKVPPCTSWLFDTKANMLILRCSPKWISKFLKLKSIAYQVPLLRPAVEVNAQDLAIILNNLTEAPLVNGVLSIDERINLKEIVVVVLLEVLNLLVKRKALRLDLHRSHLLVLLRVDRGYLLVRGGADLSLRLSWIHFGY